MNDAMRRKLVTLAERIAGDDISIMMEVRMEHRIDELEEVTPDGLYKVLAQVLSSSPDQVAEKLESHEDSQLILQELVEGLGGV